jgi:vacuolar protein sorting-associated protein 52
METMLGGFQTDLHAISAEIQSLQQRSLAMNIKLRNRKVTRSLPTAWGAAAVQVTLTRADGHRT